jgi:hypothetical protein
MFSETTTERVPTEQHDTPDILVKAALRRVAILTLSWLLLLDFGQQLF